MLSNKSMSPISHHLFEGVLYGSNHQALVLDLLLSKKAWWRRGAARGAWCTCGPTQGSSPGQGTVRSVSLEVGITVWLLAQHGGGWRCQVAQNLYDGLKLAGDVVL